MIVRRVLLATLAALLVAACGSKPDGERILGRWRAERMQMQGVSVPIGPEFVVSRQELRSPDGEVRIPISAISAEGETVTLDVPLGLGLSFRFESADRISFDLPLVGKIYYQRVGATRPELTLESSVSLSEPKQAITIVKSDGSASARAASASEQASGSAGNSIDLVGSAERKLAANNLDEAEALLRQARAQHGDPALVDFYMATVRMRQSDPDAAVRSLRDAFQNGFRDFKRLDSAADLVPLRTDPRYKALLTRYR